MAYLHSLVGDCHCGDRHDTELPVNQPGPKVNRDRQIVETYNYTNEESLLLFQTVRWEPKDFSQRRPDGKGGWKWDLQGVRRVLYRLPELMAADPSRPVFIVEGEKDADRLWDEGLVATTNPMAA